MTDLQLDRFLVNRQILKLLMNKFSDSACTQQQHITHASNMIATERKTQLNYCFLGFTPGLEFHEWEKNPLWHPYYGTCLHSISLLVCGDL